MGGSSDQIPDCYPLCEKEPTAFFLRLEHVYEDFDLAFEEGNSTEFDAWLKSDAEGWLFLDSIDEARLCGDYLRDARSNRGMFVLVRRGKRVSWKLPGRAKGVAFEELVDAVRARWLDISDGLANVEDVAVIGIDLTRRAATKETE